SSTVPDSGWAPQRCRHEPPCWTSAGTASWLSGRTKTTWNTFESTRLNARPERGPSRGNTSPRMKRTDDLSSDFGALMRRSVYLTLLVPLTACGGSAAAGALATRADSAGITIVTNTDASWREGDGWQIDAEPRLEIGP